MKSQRAELLKKIKEDETLKMPQKSLLYALAHTSRGGETVMSMQELAAAAGVCLRTAHTHLRELQKRGYLTIDGTRGRGKVNHYHLVMEEQEGACL